MEPANCNTGSPDACAANLGWIQFQAGDFVSAYRSVVPAAERGDRGAIELIVEICQRAGDAERAAAWQAKLS